VWCGSCGVEVWCGSIPVGKIAEKAVYYWQHGTVFWVPN